MCMTSTLAALVHTISADHVRSHTDGINTPTFQLSPADRMVALEAELFNLRTRHPKTASNMRTRAQRAREPTPLATIEEVDKDLLEEEPPEIERVNQPIRPIIVPVPEPAKTPQIEEEPEHPYRNARDAAYAPPVARNVGAAVKTPPVKVNVPAYKSIPSIYSSDIATDVYKRAMDASITITQRELLSISPEVRSQVREVTTTRRMPTVTPSTVQSSLTVVDDADEDSTPVPTFALQDTLGRLPPPGAAVVGDPIESYYNSLSPGESPDIDRLKVAMESTAIRSILAIVDTRQKKECTVDPGCQVVAMSESTCHGLSLAYDPRIRLQMESANGTFDWSLGLARNVPFLVGIITVYLQVHVIRSPSYDILLGRPFDVLTESIIRNYANEDQTITIKDPNSQKQCTIPTFARGTYISTPAQQTDF